MALTTSLALSACGGTQDTPDPSAAPEGEGTTTETQTETEPQAAVYDFTTETLPGDGGPVQVVFPQDLRSEVNVPLDSITLSPREVDSTEYCAVNVELQFAEGGREALEAPSFEGDEREGGNRDEQVPIQGTDAILHSMNLAENGADFIDQETTYQTSARDISDLESGDIEEGTYVNDDLSEIAVVQKCALENASQADAWEPIHIPQIMGDDTPNNTEDAATFSFTIMKSGAIGIVDGEVEGFAPDANGDWVAD